MKNGHYRLGYIPELDGLRGVAIIIVMASHADVPFLKGGFVGVDIFFVLSGFLISALLVQEFDRLQSINLKHFYMRRVLRLAPALISMLLIFCLASLVFLTEEHAYKNYIDSIISLFYLSNWARAFSIHPPDFLRHTWSLSIEEQFYIIWPVVLLVLLRSSMNRYHVAVAAVTIALLSWCWRISLSALDATAERLFDGLDTRADGLMLGCALGIVISSGLIEDKAKAVLSKSLVVIAPLAAVALLGFVAFSRWDDPGMFYLGYIIVETLTVVVILDVLLNSRSILRKLLAIKWLVWVGTISYGIYLWHYPIDRAMRALGYHRLAVITIGSLITLIVSAISYYYLERPILKTKKRFTRGAANNSIQPASASLRSPEAADA